jgi:ABC-type spermidine/putrescine transport system permease subunit I
MYTRVCRQRIALQFCTPAVCAGVLLAFVPEHGQIVTAASCFQQQASSTATRCCTKHHTVTVDCKLAEVLAICTLSVLYSLLLVAM